MPRKISGPPESKNPFKGLGYEIIPNCKPKREHQKPDLSRRIPVFLDNKTMIFVKSEADIQLAMQKWQERNS